MDFLAAVVAIVALVFVLRMRKRMTDLELRIAELTGIQPAPPQPAPKTPTVTEQPFVAAEPPAPKPVAMSHAERMIEGAFDASGSDAAQPASSPPSGPAEPPAPGKS